LLGCAAGASHAQSSSQLPQKWDESVRALAENIVAAASPARAISLEVKNISSLGPADVAAIREELENDLVHRGIHFGQTSSTEVRVEVTLSENDEKFVWAAETHANNGVRLAIVDVVRRWDNAMGKPVNSVVLGRKLVWQQTGKFLDFSMYTGFDESSSTLQILEPERVVIYVNTGGHWQLERVVAAPHHAPWQRDLRGSIDASSGHIILPGMMCLAANATSVELQCTPAQSMTNGSPTTDASQSKIEGRERGDELPLRSACDGYSVFVATGTGDWTQPDSIQAYLEKDGRAVTSGDPLQTDGPVTALDWDALGAARFVVHNLKTGNYEGYIVTASCNH
jgi:hypothetical protein